MIRGPTSSVAISSTSPLLILRLFFQPPNSTVSTFTFPSAATERPSGKDETMVRTSRRATTRADGTVELQFGGGPEGAGDGRDRARPRLIARGVGRPPDFDRSAGIS